MPIGMGTALAVGAGVSAVGGIASSYLGGQAQVSAENKAIAVQQEQQAKNEGYLGPYNTAGQTVLPELENLLSGDPKKMEAQLQALPGYQFTRDQGLLGVQNSASARGLGVSGAALKGAADFTTGLADATYGNQVNRLQTFANMGEAAGAAEAGVGTQLAGNIGQAEVGIGNAQAGMYSGMANALGGGVNQASSLYMLDSMMRNMYGTSIYGSGSGATVPAGGAPVYGIGG